QRDQGRNRDGVGTASQVQLVVAEAHPDLVDRLADLAAIRRVLAERAKDRAPHRREVDRHRLRERSLAAPQQVEEVGDRGGQAHRTDGPVMASTRGGYFYADSARFGD